jgi:hypothetical protein
MMNTSTLKVRPQFGTRCFRLWPVIHYPVQKRRCNSNAEQFCHLNDFTMPDLTFLPFIVPVTFAAYAIFVLIVCYLYGKQENFRSTGKWAFKGSAMRNYFVVLPFHFTFSSFNPHGGVYLLLGTRVLSLVFFLGVACLWSYSVNKGTSLFYFTNWNICLIAVYFILATVASIVGVCYGSQIDKTTASSANVVWSPRLRWVGFSVQVLFEVAGASALFITVIAFSLLNQSFEFWNVAHHFATSISFLIEASQNTMVVRWEHVLLCMLWALCYLIYIWPAVATGEVTNWPYDFLGTESATSFIWYFVLFFSNGLFYSLWYFISRLKYEYLLKDFVFVKTFLPFHLCATGTCTGTAMQGTVSVACVNPEEL